MATDRLDNHLILLVEDEPFIQMDIQQGLEEAGARVCAAQTIQEALALLDIEPITASILDFKLGGGTADDLCHQLTARKIPFVIYSGYTNVEGECSKLVTRVLGVLVASALPNQC
jgi:DNA-binding response OmpR family regulator